MATYVGTATLNFGAAPGSSFATTTVTGQTDIGAGDYVEAWLQGDSTATHNAYEHLILPINIRAGDIVPNTSFTIYASTTFRLTGTFTVRWVRSN